MRVLLFAISLMMPLASVTAASPVTMITNAPYTISSPGTYRLGNTISWTGTGLTNAVALTINASNVTLDLRGNTLGGNPYYGTDLFTAFGMVIDGVTNVTVSNGVIDGFHSFGVVINNSAQVKLASLTIRNINNLGAWSGLYTVDFIAGVLAQNVTNVVLSNTLIQNVNLQPTNNNTAFAEAGGVVVIGGSNITNTGVTVSGVSNGSGVAQGIAGLNVLGMTVLRSSIQNISTGEGATNNMVGHTCLGMVFSPSRLSANIVGATVVNGGSGYSGYPSVTISAVTNDAGSNGYGYAMVSPQGQVTNIVITGIGTNYETFPQVSISGPGTGAEAVTQPSQVSYTTIGYCGNIRVEDCGITNVTGAIDDAHGISLFTVTNAVVRRVRVNGVTDGVNAYGFGGSKATGFENYGNPAVADCNITLEDCVALNITAVGPGDLAANGFSVAGNGIRISRCTASTIKVMGSNRLDPLASPGNGVGFGWAPDVRIQNIYPAKNALIENCTATGCAVGFDTYNFQNSRWRNNRIGAQTDGIRYLQEPSGTVRTIFGSLWNEVVDAELYLDGIKPIPIYNQAEGNVISPSL